MVLTVPHAVLTPYTSDFETFEIRIRSQKTATTRILEKYGENLMTFVQFVGDACVSDRRFDVSVTFVSAVGASNVIKIGGLRILTAG